MSLSTITTASLPTANPRGPKTTSCPHAAAFEVIRARIEEMPWHRARPHHPAGCGRVYVLRDPRENQAWHFVRYSSAWLPSAPTMWTVLFLGGLARSRWLAPSAAHTHRRCRASRRRAHRLAGRPFRCWGRPWAFRLDDHALKLPRTPRWCHGFTRQAHVHASVHWAFLRWPTSPRRCRRSTCTRVDLFRIAGQAQPGRRFVLRRQRCPEDYRRISHAPG